MPSGRLPQQLVVVAVVAVAFAGCEPDRPFCPASDVPLLTMLEEAGARPTARAAVRQVAGCTSDRERFAVVDVDLRASNVDGAVVQRRMLAALGAGWGSDSVIDVWPREYIFEIMTTAIEPGILRCDDEDIDDGVQMVDFLITASAVIEDGHSVEEADAAVVAGYAGAPMETRMIGAG